MTDPKENLSHEELAFECNVIRWLLPSLARRVGRFCYQHDQAYKNASKTGIYRVRDWLKADALWVARSAASLCSDLRFDLALVALIFGLFMPLGSWYLYFDLDKR